MAPHLISRTFQALTREMLVTTRSEKKIDSAVFGAVIAAATFVLDVLLALSAKATVKFAAEPLKVAPKVLFVNVH
jgi:hypothetical protein